MKIAVFSDLHAHMYKEFDEKSIAGSSRLNNIIETLRFIRDDCHAKGIEYVLFGGDLFHTRAKVDTIVSNKVYDTFKTFNPLGIQIIGIAGNHDQRDNSDVPEHSMHTFNDLPGVHIYGDMGTHFLPDFDTGFEDVLIHCVPYSKNTDRTKEWIDKMVAKGRGDFSCPIHICLFHAGIDGASVGTGSYPMAEAFKPEDFHPDYYDFVVGGHFHKAQSIGGYANFLYTGAPIQHDFGDEGEDKGYYILDLKEKDIEFVPIPNQKFVTVVGVGEDVKNVIAECANYGHYVRALLKEDEIDVFKSMAPADLKYKIVPEKEYKEENRIDVKIGMSEEEVVTKYAEKHNPDALDIGLEILKEVKGLS